MFILIDKVQRRLSWDYGWRTDNCVQALHTGIRLFKRQGTARVVARRNKAAIVKLPRFAMSEVGGRIWVPVLAPPGYPRERNINLEDHVVEDFREW